MDSAVERTPGWPGYQEWMKPGQKVNFWPVDQERAALIEAIEIWLIIGCPLKLARDNPITDGFSLEDPGYGFGV